MTEKEKFEVCEKMAWEGGLEETIIRYSDFPEIKDKTFRKLVQEFKDAYNNLSSYLNWEEYEE